MAQLIVEARRLGHNTPQSAESVDLDAELRHFDSMRVYYFEPEHLDAIIGVVKPRIDHLAPQQVEIVQADICRPELLVEIEGTASID